MLRPKQVLLPAFLITLISCNIIAKQEEQVASINLSNDTITLKQKIIDKAIDDSVRIKTPFLSKKIEIISKSTGGKINSQTSTSLVEDFKIFEQDFQNFTINSGFDTSIICKEGTKIKIDHSSFLTESTQAEVKGKITLQVKEFYKTSDIVLAGLSTHSDSSILETGGMLFIQAVSKGQLCRLKDNSPIEISFPFTERKDSMFLFSGNREDKKINWAKLAFQKDSSQQLVEEIAIYPGEDVGANNFFQTTLIYPDLLAERGIGGRVEIDFVVDEMGIARDVNFRISSHKLLRDAVLATLPKMLRWKPAKRNGVPIKSTVSQVITFVNETTLADSVFKTNFEATVNDSNLGKTSVADTRHYVFSTSKLGWINCDRFYGTKKARTDFSIDCGDFTDLDVKLVFHKFKAILADYTLSKSCDFKNIPVDEVVSIVVVKKLGNTTFISLTESNTSNARINNLQFEEVTMDKLKQKLEALNNLR